MRFSKGKKNETGGSNESHVMCSNQCPVLAQNLRIVTLWGKAKSIKTYCVTGNEVILPAHYFDCRKKDGLSAGCSRKR